MTRHLRPCALCSRPLYSLSGQRKRHPDCAMRARDSRRLRDISEAEIERRYAKAKAKLRGRAA